MRLAPHDDEAEVLRGGMLLSYGLHREAGEVFAQLLDAGAKPAVQDRARFFLAKIRYQRGLLPEALDALARLAATCRLPWRRSARCCTPMCCLLARTTPVLPSN